MGQTDSWRHCTTEDKKIKVFTLNNVVLMEVLCICCGFLCIDSVYRLWVSCRHGNGWNAG